MLCKKKNRIMRNIANTKFLSKLAHFDAFVRMLTILIAYFDKNVSE